MTKVDISEYDLSEEEAEKALERKQKKKERKKGSSGSSSSSSSSSSSGGTIGGLILLLIVFGLIIMFIYGSDAEGILVGSMVVSSLRFQSGIEDSVWNCVVSPVCE